MAMTSPDDTRHGQFGALLGLTTRQWRRAVDQQLQPFGLTEATWRPLLQIARTPEALRQKELAAALSLDSSAVVRLLDSLQTAGLIERREDAADRRAKSILLTDTGKAMVARVEESARQVRDTALVGISDADIATTMRVMRQINQTLTITSLAPDPSAPDSPAPSSQDPAR
jgi:MarR family transcriptional regulator for hemolysin